MTTYPIDETMALWREGLLSAGECLRGPGGRSIGRTTNRPDGQEV